MKEITTPACALDGCQLVKAEARIKELERMVAGLEQTSHADWKTIEYERNIVAMKDRHIAENNDFYRKVNDATLDIITGLRAEIARLSGLADTQSGRSE